MINSRSSLPLLVTLAALPLGMAAQAQIPSPSSAGPSSSAPAAGNGQATSPGNPSGAGTGMGAPSGGSIAAPAPAGGALPSAPPLIAPGNVASPPTGGYVPGTVGPAPVSPAVPLLGSVLPALASPTLPPIATGVLPAPPPVSLAAQTPGSVPLVLTADDAAALAAQRNLGVLAALRDTFAARDAVSAARVLAPPLFTIGPALEAGGTTDGLLFLQPLEINGVRGARTDIARARQRLAQAQAILSLQDLTYAARLYYYALAQAQATLALQQNLLASDEHFDRIAQTQVRLGARPAIEAVQTAIEVSRARQLVAQATGEEQAARAALNAFLGRAPLDGVDTTRAFAAATLPTPGLLTPDIVGAQAEALRGRAEIAVAQAGRDLPEAQAALYRAQGRPDISPSFRISQITPTYMQAGVGVVITVPIDYGTRRNLIREQQQGAAAQQDRLVGAEAQARLDAEQAVVRLQAAQTVLAEYDAGFLANAHTVLTSAIAGYQTGGTTIIAVLEAQRTYRQILAEQLSAQASVAQARAALDRAVGAVPRAALTALQRDFQKPAPAPAMH